MHQRWWMEQDWLWGDSFQTASWQRSSLETLQEKRSSYPELACNLPTSQLSSKGYNFLSESATRWPVTKLKVGTNINFLHYKHYKHLNYDFFRANSQSFRNCIARLWDVLPWPTVCGPVKVWRKQEHHHHMWLYQEDKKYCLPTGLDKNWHCLIVKKKKKRKSPLSVRKRCKY